MNTVSRLVPESLQLGRGLVAQHRVAARAQHRRPQQRPARRFPAERRVRPAVQPLPISLPRAGFHGFPWHPVGKRLAQRDNLGLGIELLLPGGARVPHGGHTSSFAAVPDAAEQAGDDAQAVAGENGRLRVRAVVRSAALHRATGRRRSARRQNSRGAGGGLEPPASRRFRSGERIFSGTLAPVSLAKPASKCPFTCDDVSARADPVIVEPSGTPATCA
jgi:hypothetical protein